MTGEPFLNFFAELPAIHVDREVAILGDQRGRTSILIRKPSEPPGRPNRAVGRRDLDVLASPRRC